VKQKIQFPFTDRQTDRQTDSELTADRNDVTTGGKNSNGNAVPVQRSGSFIGLIIGDKITRRPSVSASLLYRCVMSAFMIIAVVVRYLLDYCP